MIFDPIHLIFYPVNLISVSAVVKPRLWREFQPDRQEQAVLEARI